MYKYFTKMFHWYTTLFLLNKLKDLNGYISTIQNFISFLFQYSYFNTKQRRHEMAVLEMYEGKNQSNATVFSSFSAPQQPLVMRQSFIFPLPMYTMTTTITEKGITTKDILSKNFYLYFNKPNFEDGMYYYIFSLFAFLL